MIIQTLQNKSVVIIGTLIGEADTVIRFRQFAIGDKVLVGKHRMTLYDVETLADSTGLHNVYSIRDKFNNGLWRHIREITLLEYNPRPAPSDVFDCLADCLPVMQFGRRDGKIIMNTGD